MAKRRVTLTLNCFLLLALILTSCGGMPGLRTPTPAVPTPTSFQQALPPALVETDPPLGSVIGHQSPITFYFNEAVNKSSAESALTGLPAGTFTWNDDATLVFTPTQPYPPNTTLDFSIAGSLQSANGFGMAVPIELSFSVADTLRATIFLPKPDSEDVNVDAAIAVSFNQPVVALGAETADQPLAFNIQPSAKGRGEWINTSTYIFYPEPALAGGTEYTVSLNPALKTVTGVGFTLDGGAGAGSAASTWKFTTSRPRVVKLEPSVEALLPLDPAIKLTFNQPMDTQSVEASFMLSGTEGAVRGKFSWNKDDTEMTFTPDDLLGRNVGYILNLGATAQSKGGLILGSEYGAVFTTYDNFAVTGTKTDFGSTTFTFNAPLDKANYDKLVAVSPDVDNLQAVTAEDGLSLNVYADFMPDTNYTIELSGRLKDRWGQSLGDAFKLDVHTPPMPSMLNVPLYGWSIAFVRPDEATLNAKAVNIQSTNTTVAPLSLQDFFSLQSSQDNQQAYVPTDSHIYPQSFTLPQGGPSDVKIGLAQRNNQLLPGLYYVELSSPQITSPVKNVYLVVSSQVNLTLKLGATEALVWAVDLPSQQPIANAPVTIYDEVGAPIGSGTTDDNGLWKGTVGAYSSQVYAMLGTPGDENFGLAVDQWSWGLSAWDFGYSQRVQPPHTQIYLYTDRPIYRPGQTVYFRGVARQAFNGRYELPPVNTVQLQLQDANGVQLSNFDMQLSPYGTFNGEFKLAEDVAPGYYTFQNGPLEFYFSFQVAEYRKPEINLNVDFSASEIKPGDSAKATVNARYFFEAPAGDLEVQWALYAKPDTFQLPNYETGLVNTSWLDVFRSSGESGSDYFGKLIEQGTDRTDPQGLLSIELPAIPGADTGQLVTLEVTAQDESGLPVSARAQMRLHPADFYIGLRPEQWIGRADSPINFEVYTVDWAQNPSGDKKLTAEFKQVRWEKQVDSTGFPTYTPVYLPGSSSDLVTGQDGKARLSFTPPTAGTYLLDVSGEGAHAQTLIWVGGAGSAAWPDLPDQRLELTADRDSYKVGDTAKIFIPNPFAVNALALVTVERGLVSQADVIRLSGSGREYSLALTEDEAPNVYVSVTVLGQGNDFRYGLVNVLVAPDAEALNVQVVPNPTQ
ncbi:MAG TPA: Ig-like domain-containing protein, partial [Anaerolineales bacterium]|nr:Ig-like domain-containing protein [Anaerolineales bacterium]